MQNHVIVNPDRANIILVYAHSHNNNLNEQLSVNYFQNYIYFVIYFLQAETKDGWLRYDLVKTRVGNKWLKTVFYEFLLIYNTL